MLSLDRSRIVRALRLPISLGIKLNELEFKKRRLSDVSNPIVVGIAPFKLFPFILRVDMLKKFPISEGIFPAKTRLLTFIERTFAKSGPGDVPQVTPWLEHQVGSLLWSGHTIVAFFDQTVLPGERVPVVQ